MPSEDPPQGDGLPPRRAARTLLTAVLDRKRSLDDALGDLDPGLSQRDRAFARQLAATALRRLGQIDAVSALLLRQGPPKRAPDIPDILRLGLAQILFLRTPAHAAVSTSVDLARETAEGRFAGLVNAVLRRAAREAAQLLPARDAAELNTPPWLWARWTAAYGADAARAIAARHLEEPPLDITAKADAGLWAARLEAEALPTGTLRRRHDGPVTELPGYAEGAWWVQDAGAALPARLFGPVAGLTVVDLCAAPGGKTAQLAAAGARVIAVDRSAPRLDRLRANLRRLGLEVETVEADATAWQPPTPADAVLLDAPCTSTGTIRRHPDIARLKRPGDVAKLAATQARLLAHAATLLRPGGLLVWSTCSLEPEEGEERIARLLAQGAPLRREPVSPAEIGGLAEIVTPLGEIRSLPSHGAAFGGLDGFHIARLRRIG
ncbi:MAG: methyltransferase domain-containing protein [Rhodospirillaceae bacterium]|nr:methyltransferase domain-containing protein [Rhodospirillaceae bacterium]